MPSTPSTQSMLADRRWLIGIAITLVFGTFGSVMAWLGYAGRTKAAVPAAAAAAPPAPPSPANEPSPSRGRGKRRDRD